MRKSLRDTETIDRFLLGQMCPEEEEAFRVRMLVEGKLHEDVRLQRRAHLVIQLDAIFERLMREGAITF
ncbi:hypothetical protein [Dinghuibacter silviterrae]|uniref:Uncharacterized protein n=1 Tax=Dinghuibacter silviterrae TaxID=1539049 RepID=A0A4R8DW09_9BACT|nr:hypothetical protein [Dinghuibacter silviterrae]TDX02399.1 hypothetical protein EDB95_3457 [Dinghuibacter silviterrae]